MSILTACMMVTKPFLDGFASGGLENAQVESYHMNTCESGPQARSKKKSVAVDDDLKRSVLASRISNMATAQPQKMARTGLVEILSISSGRSDRMIIERTDQWFIEYEKISKLSSETLEALHQAGRLTFGKTGLLD